MKWINIIVFTILVILGFAFIFDYETVIEGAMDADKFIAFFLKLRGDSGCPILVIADNARYHHANKVKAFLETQQGEIMLAFLPAHSPELNPDEQVWNRAKAEVGKYPHSKQGRFGKDHSFRYASYPTKSRAGEKLF